MNRILEQVQSGDFDPLKMFTGNRDTFLEVKTAIENISNNLTKETCLEFLLSKIIPTAFDKTVSDATRDEAIEVGFHILKFVNVSILNAKDQEKIFTSIEESYAKTVGELRDCNYANWDKLWIFLIRLCHDKIHAKMSLANKLLRVVEVAFRNSTSVDQRLKAYDCWKELIDNSSLNVDHMCSAKQIKLLVTPLKAKFSRTPVVIKKRCDIFVYLLEKLEEKATLCLKEFLEFCFGPFEDKNHVERMRQGKSVPDVCIKSTKILMELLGHSHNEAEICISSSDIYLHKAVINESNFPDFAEILLNSVVECCVLLNVWNTDSLKSNTIIKCLWRSLLILIHKSSDDTKRKCGTVLNNSLRKLLERSEYNKDLDVLLGNVFVLLLKDDMVEYLREVLFDIAMNLLHHVKTDYCYFNEDEVLFFINSCFESGNGSKFSKIASNYFKNDSKCSNSKILSEVWLKCDFTASSTVSNLIWPVRHLQHFKDDTALKDKWTALYNEECKSESAKVAILQETEKIFTENPLLVSNIVTFLQLIANIESSAGKDFVARFMRLTELVLTLPNISDTDLKKLSTMVLIYCDQNKYFYKLEGIDQALDKLCGCIEHIIAIHKDYSILNSLHDHLEKASSKLLAKFSRRLMSLLESLMLNEDNTTTNSARKLIELLEIKDSEPDSIPLASTRSLRIINMANVPSKPRLNNLKLFRKNNDFSAGLKKPSTPKKIEIKKKEIVVDEDKSADYVKIDTEVKLDVKKLNEHQKEVLKKRREDIPALYQDLTQSQSRDLFVESNDEGSKEPKWVLVEEIKTSEEIKSVEEIKIGEETKAGEDIEASSVKKRPLEEQDEESACKKLKLDDEKPAEETQTAEEDVNIPEESEKNEEKPSEISPEEDTSFSKKSVKTSKKQASKKVKQQIEGTKIKEMEESTVDQDEPDAKVETLNQSEEMAVNSEEGKNEEKSISKNEEKPPETSPEEDTSFSKKSVKTSKKQASKKVKQQIEETKIEKMEESRVGQDEPDAKEETSNQSEETAVNSEEGKNEEKSTSKNEEKPLRKSARQVKRRDYDYVKRRSRSQSKKSSETVVENPTVEETAKKGEEPSEETSLRKSKRQQNRRQQREEASTMEEVKKGEDQSEELIEELLTKVDRRLQDGKKNEEKTKKRRSGSKSCENSWNETISDGNQNKILLSEDDNISKQETIRQIVSKVKKQVMRSVSNESETTSSSKGDVYEFTDESTSEEMKKQPKKWKKSRTSLGREDYVVKRRKKAKSKSEEQLYHVTADCSTPLSKSQSLRAVPSSQESETITIVITRSPPEEGKDEEEADEKPSPSRSKKPKRKQPDSEDVIESSQPPPPATATTSRCRDETARPKTRSSTLGDEFPARATVSRRHSLTEASTEDAVEAAKRTGRSKSLDRLDPDSEVSFLTTTSALPDTLTAPTPESSNDLPGSPITCDTPDRKVELLNNTLDISPINSGEGEVAKRTPVLATKEVSNVRVARLLQMVNPDVAVSNESPRWFGKRTTSSPSTSRVRKMRMRKEESLDILTFSREVPSPLTVPASGILKRKFGNLDETSTPSPKRKRVNFSDPAITDKKIFIKESEEYEQGEESMKESLNSDREIGNRQDMILTIKEFCDSNLRDLSSVDCSELKSALRRLIKNLNVPEIVEVVSEYLTNLDGGRMSEVSKALVDGDLVERCVLPLLENQQVFEMFLPRLMDVLEKLPEVKIERFLKELARAFGDDRIDGVFKKHSNDKEAEEHVVNNFDCDRMKEMMKRYFVKLEEGGKKEQFLVDLISFASEELPHTKQFLQVHVDLLKNFVNRMMDDC